MAWVRLDDNFHWHPKVAPLSDAAYRLYVGALCYCNRYQLAGRITPPDLVTIAGGGAIRRRERSVTELVAAVLWTVEDWGWQIHDYLLYQPDPTKQAAGRAGGQASAQARAQAERQAHLEAPAQPPSRPVPSRGGKTPLSPPAEPGGLIASRGWRGGEESLADVLQRVRRPEVLS